MKLKKMTGVMVVGASIVLAGNAMAAATSIAQSWHNLGAGQLALGLGTPNNPAGTANHTADTGEICVFCHTPHGADISAAVPLWNRALPVAATQYPVANRYSAVGTSTFDATEMDVGSISLACLSCHDGTQALDAVINIPGSGGYDPAAARIGGGTGMTGDDRLASGALATTIIQNLGTDLRNDHPVSMQYGGGGVSGTVTATNDLDFATVSSQVLTTAGRVWWVETGYGAVANARDRKDVILYTRDNGGTIEPFVECGSCHDPHNVDNPTFLRVANSAAANLPALYSNANGGPSELCLTCHTK